MAFPTPRDCFRSAIARWEGEWQANPNDSGNYAHCQDGVTKLIGTMRGVTPTIYAQYIGVDPCSLTPEAMQSGITLDVATAIGVRLFYVEPGFVRLTWSPLVDIADDIGWGSGPATGIKMLQRLIGTGIDGIIGPETETALNNYLEAHEIGPACDQLTEARAQFYIDISPPGSKNARFRTGWLRRANWYRTTNDEWWSKWKGWTMPIPAESSRPIGPIA